MVGYVYRERKEIIRLVSSQAFSLSVGLLFVGEGNL